MKQEALSQIESISGEYDVDKIEAYIDYLETKIDDLDSEKESLQDTIHILEADLEDSEHSFLYPSGYNRSIVTDLILGKLFDNLGLVPMDELESLIDKYAM